MTVEAPQSLPEKCMHVRCRVSLGARSPRSGAPSPSPTQSRCHAIHARCTGHRAEGSTAGDAGSRARRLKEAEAAHEAAEARVRELRGRLGALEEAKVSNRSDGTDWQVQTAGAPA